MANPSLPLQGVPSVLGQEAAAGVHLHDADGDLQMVPFSQAPQASGLGGNPNDMDSQHILFQGMELVRQVCAIPVSDYQLQLQAEVQQLYAVCEQQQTNLGYVSVEAQEAIHNHRRLCEEALQNQQSQFESVARNYESAARDVQQVELARATSQSNIVRSTMQTEMASLRQRLQEANDANAGLRQSLISQEHRAQLDASQQGSQLRREVDHNRDVAEATQAHVRTQENQMQGLQHQLQDAQEQARVAQDQIRLAQEQARAAQEQLFIE